MKPEVGGTKSMFSLSDLLDPKRPPMLSTSFYEVLSGFWKTALESYDVVLCKHLLFIYDKKKLWLINASKYSILGLNIITKNLKLPLKTKTMKNVINQSIFFPFIF